MVLKQSKHFAFTLKEIIELYTSECVEFFIAGGKVIASWTKINEKGKYYLTLIFYLNSMVYKL